MALISSLKQRIAPVPLGTEALLRILNAPIDTILIVFFVALNGCNRCKGVAKLSENRRKQG